MKDGNSNNRHKQVTPDKSRLTLLLEVKIQLEAQGKSVPRRIEIEISKEINMKKR